MAGSGWEPSEQVGADSSWKDDCLSVYLLKGRSDFATMQYVFKILTSHPATAWMLAGQAPGPPQPSTPANSWQQRWSSFVDGLAGIWYFEITRVDGSPITVAKIVLSLAFVLLGFLVARLVSKLILRRFLNQIGLNQHASAALQSLVFYLLLITFCLLALRLASVPLTAFAIVGGALAIGVGFGSQNIVNNFISGLILLAERPIRIGDLIEVDNLYGTVEHIGPRSTKVRSSENVDIIVPNSSFLEKNVVNWTLSDDRYRASVSVGVAYGSPVEEVEELIRQAVKNHPKVLPEPAPIILFAEFGDNSLNFEAHYWIRLKRLMDSRIIASQVRHQIDALFRQTGITIAFPQRDVHLDSLKPLEVRMVEKES